MIFGSKSSWCAASLGLALGASLAFVGCGGSKPAAQPPVVRPINEPAAGAEPEAARRVETAIKLIQAKSFADAKRLLSQAVEEDPKDARAQYYLGVAADQLGEQELAKQSYRRALELDAKLTEAAINLSALLLDAGDFEGALLATEVGLKAEPGNIALLSNRGLAERAAGKTEAALASFKQLVKLEPKDEGLRFTYFELLAQLGKKAEALAEWDALSKTKNPDVLAAASKSLAKLDAYEACVGALSRAIELKRDAEFLVRRGLCRQNVQPYDGKAEVADYEAAVELNASYAPGYYYLGMALAKLKENAQATLAFEKVVALGDGNFTERAKKQLEMLRAKPAPKKR